MLLHIAKLQNQVRPICRTEHVERKINFLDSILHICPIIFTITSLVIDSSGFFSHMGSPTNAAKFTTTSHSLINGYSRSTDLKSPLMIFTR